MTHGPPDLGDPRPTLIQRMRRYLPALQVAVSVALLVVLFSAVDGATAARALAGADFGWLGAALLAMTLQTILSARRWQITANRLDQRFGFFHAMAEYYFAQIINQSLPGGMVGDASRAVRARHRAGLVRAGQAVAFERLTGQVAMVSVLALGFVITLILPGGVVWPRWLGWPVLGALLSFGALVFVMAKFPRLPGAIGRAQRDMGGAWAASVLAPDVRTRQIALSLGTTACTIAAFAFCARATGTDLSLGAMMALVPLILLTMLIPITVSGWGLREGAAVALFPLAGATGAAGLAASVSFGLVFIIATLPGLVLVLRSGAFRSPQDTARDTS